MHHRNAAERAMRTWKKQFITILCGCNRNFPMNLWDKIVPQAVLALNLLRCSNLNLNLPVFTQVWRQFNFNRTPIAPPGTMVMVHKKPATCETWAPHASDAWYLGPAVHHYRCYRVWVWETKAERVSDTLAWIPTNIIMSIHGSADRAIATTTNLVASPATFHPPQQLRQ